MLVKNWRIVLVSLMVPVLVGSLFLFIPTGQTYGAPDTLDLQLEDPAVIRWDIINIMPGDSGIEPINLHNSGDIPGYIYIWISGIVDGEGLNPESETGDTSEPGELSSYILLDIVNPGMAFGKLTGTGYMQLFYLPVKMASFPDSSNQALFVLNTVINPGETLELQWQWQLPTSVGNQAQGDTVSFTFNYMLSTFYTDKVYIEPPLYTPPPTVPPTTPTTTTPAVEPPTPPGTDIPEDDINITDETDISYVELIAPDTTTPVTLDTEETTSNRDILAQASLGVAVSGTVAMTILAIIERIRRHRRMKIGN